MSNDEVPCIPNCIPTVLSQGYALNPVKGPDGEIQLYDIYIGTEWIGSRRTIAHCHETLRNHGVVP
jgi:hypothetical protein